MQKAYIARLELEYIVVAETREAAVKLALKAHRDDHVSVHDVELLGMTHLPPQYADGDDLVHSDGLDDMTVDEAAKLPGGYAYKAAPAPMPSDPL